MLKKLQNEKKGDIPLLIAVIALSLFGILMIYSASSFNAFKDYGDPLYFVKKQIVGLGVGLAAMIFTANFDYRKYAKIKYFLLPFSLIILGLIFTPLGVEIYGAKRWIGIGSITVQPSEIAKFCFIIFTAAYFAEKPSRTKTFLGILPVICYGGAICLLIILEPNMSITVCVGMLMICMLVASGVKWRHLLIILIPCALLVPVLIIMEPYRLQRLYAFLNPWASPKGEGYQLIQSLYALGSGGWFGVGLFNSRQKYKFLPFAESDFILSVIGEELGFIGTALLFAVIAFIIYRGAKIAVKAKNFYGYIITLGITFIYGIQTLINAMVVTGSIPPTGLPLPLISCGNTSLIVFLAAFGIVYNVSKDIDEY